MRTHNSSPLRCWFSTLFISVALALTGCGGSNSDYHSDHNHNHDHDHDHHEESHGRLLFSLSTNSNLGVFDQTATKPAFSTFTRNGGSSSNLVLSHDGLSIAVLDDTELRILSSGLEHLHGHGSSHTHPIEAKGSAITNVQKVIATQQYFSILSDNNRSVFIDAEGKEQSSSDTGVIYPSLLLEGNHRLKFTHADNKTTANVISSNGDLLPTPVSFSCAGIQQTAQTNHLSIVLCTEGTVFWLTADHQADGLKFFSRQLARYGALIDGIKGVLIADAEKDTIAIYGQDKLLLITAHGNHIHTGNVSAKFNEGNIEQVVSISEDSHIAVLYDTGTLAFAKVNLKGVNPTIGTVKLETIHSDQPVESTHLQLVGSAENLWVINKANGELYLFDAHDDDFHQHQTYQHNDLKDLHSVVFAHHVDQHDNHQHDHDDEHANDAVVDFDHEH